jgi:hypothetical protein
VTGSASVLIVVGDCEDHTAVAAAPPALENRLFR